MSCPEAPARPSDLGGSGRAAALAAGRAGTPAPPAAAAAAGTGRGLARAGIAGGGGSRAPFRPQSRLGLSRTRAPAPARDIWVWALGFAWGSHLCRAWGMSEGAVWRLESLVLKLCCRVTRDAIFCYVMLWFCRRTSISKAHPG